MRAAVGALAKATLLASGHYRRRLAGATFSGVVVLCYHGVRPDDSSDGSYPFAQLHVRESELATHCELIAQSCTPISLDAFRAAVSNGAPLPPRPVLVTFDDGYRSVAKLAAPILDRTRVPAVFFVCSGSIAERRLLWYDALARRGREADVDRAKTLTFAEWQRLELETRTTAGDDDPMAAMTVEDLRSLASNPLFAIGGHTVSHPILARASAVQQRDEIAGCLRQIETWTRAPVRSFAYPNGRPGVDFTSDTVALLSESGVDVAFTTETAFAGPARPPLEQPRFLMLSGVSQPELAHRLAYSWKRAAAQAHA